MGKNILVITGSPRDGGNSDLLADAFIEGAVCAGHEVTKWKASKKHIGGCQACVTCFSTGKACSYDDDFNELALLLMRADVIVWSTPVYWFGFPSQLKAAIDKMYSFYMGKRELHIKEAVLLTCAEMDEMWIFDGVIANYKNILSFMEWEDKGILAVPAVQNVGDVVGTTALRKAKDLGHNL